MSDLEVKKVQGRINSSRKIQGSVKDFSVNGNVSKGKAQLGLESLIVTPSMEEQNFKPTRYAYNDVKVKGIETEEKVVELNFSQTDKIEVMPSTGKYLNKINIKKDKNLLPKNILKDVEIEGIIGTHDSTKYILPEGYEDLEYTTMAYNTGYNPTFDGFQLEIDYIHNGRTESGNYDNFLRVRSTNYNEFVLQCTSNSSHTNFDYYYLNSRRSTIQIPVGERLKLYANVGSIYINDNIIHSSFYSSVSQMSETLRINPGKRFLYQIYGLKIWQHNVLQRDFIPAKRLSDGAEGLFDKVTQTFVAGY